MSEILAGEEIPLGKLAYFRARLRNALHDVVLKAFDQQRQECGLTKADLARRIHKDASQITRWLSSPQNWTLDVISDLLVALGRDIEFTSSALGESKSVEATSGKTVGLPSPRQKRSRRTELKSGYQLGLDREREQTQSAQVMM